MKIHLKALGCRLNEAELEQWSTSFQQAGHEVISTAEQADVVVLNSCAVTTEAAAKSRRLLNRLYRDNPQTRLVVSGCYATLQPEEAANIMGVDLIVPNSTKDSLPQQVLEQFSVPTMPLVATDPGENTLFMRGRQRAFIKIQDGCRYRCTFCIVTVARGDERSRTESEIIEEINQLHDQGIQEIVLTGVHVGGYGSDIESSLYQLVQRILTETAIPRIRFASVEPWDLPPDFFTLFSNPRLMPHMHLPIQSGSDSVLRRMARRCKTTEFSELVQQARRHNPLFNITTDIIVGFPGETDVEWQETLDFVQSIDFGHIHIFSYSARQGTKAARLPDQLPEAIKKQRSQQLHRIAEQQKQQWLAKQYNHVVEVLWEQPHTQNGKLSYTGYTPNYCRVELVTDTVGLDNQITQTALSAHPQELGLLLGVLKP
ncbi:tRNA (N(6)-L-threonylcarbamoyladenosine(37)-C(2))-methylthiotransferase MtaB [Thiofilum flexile]|uniref:tRNA (N(6)-L-threonylcarbamoyladenosine(37)-C(2))- methylthiotransferase MtaB n=1 Tax=Thiofilum flexile TaxID=125627 RepID=UPI0003817A58|nr:tRNA (N(6)-L-threonylcarbamoyladenosine(37)-C(2))-methylthiotransferase MtaB [Thiofilum flexile]